MLNKFATLVAGAACALAIGSFTASADGYVKGRGGPAYAGGCDNSGRFSGAYIGLHAGGGSLEQTLTGREVPVSVTATEDGVVLGGQIGYNWQKCNAVFGIEADFAWANLDSKRDFLFGIANLERETNWLGSIRTKSGVVVGDLFLYATGGIAFMNASAKLRIGSEELKFSDDTRVGWVAGVGTEYAFNDRISITSDVLYYGFGTDTGRADVNFGCCSTTVRADDTQQLWVARMGINFKLGSREAVYEPMK